MEGKEDNHARTKIASRKTTRKSGIVAIALIYIHIIHIYKYIMLYFFYHMFNVFHLSYKIIRYNCLKKKTLKVVL